MEIEYEYNNERKNFRENTLKYEADIDIHKSNYQSEKLRNNEVQIELDLLKEKIIRAEYSARCGFSSKKSMKYTGKL